MKGGIGYACTGAGIAWTETKSLINEVAGDPMVLRAGEYRFFPARSFLNPEAWQSG